MPDIEHEEPEPNPRRQTYDRRAARTRRSEEDRRCGERRRGRTGAPRGAPPRKGERRRPVDRRARFDRRLYRRRDLPAPYTSEEVLRIQRAFQTPGHRGDCPACGARFILFAARRRGRDAIRKLECRGCRKTAVVKNSWFGRVLIVTGVAGTRQDVRSLLVGAGHDVAEVAETTAALVLYREEPADVVMVDMAAAAGLDGADLIRRLHADFPEAAILAVAPRSAYGTADPLAAAQRLGAASTIRVPFLTSELLKTVTALVRPSSR